MMAGVPYLAPHEWDRLGRPPKPGRPYADSLIDDLLDQYLEADAAVEDAESDADDLEDRAQEARSKADGLVEAADLLLDQILVTRPEWERTLRDGDDPRKQTPDGGWLA